MGLAAARAVSPDPLAAGVGRQAPEALGQCARASEAHVRIHDRVRCAAPLTPENTVGTLLSPDGRTLAAVDGHANRLLWPMDGSAPKEIRGLPAADVIVGWTADSRSLIVSAPLAGRGRDIARFDLATGARQLIAAFGPSDPAGVRTIAPPLVSADGRSYAYRYDQRLSDLFVGAGLR
jgi:eukaryotic-like serine/threonine-protein kinase